MRFVATVASVLAVVWGASCASTVGGGSQTNWGSCKLDEDCSGGMVCIAEMCEVPEAGTGVESGVLRPDTGPIEDVEPGPLRESIDEPSSLEGRFGVAYRTKSGNAAFLEYLNGTPAVTPLGVPGKPVFAYDPAGQAIVLVPGASRVALDRINGNAVPSVEAPVVQTGDGPPFEVLPVRSGRAYFLVGTHIYDEAEDLMEIGLGAALDMWREWSLTYGKDARKYVSITAGLPLGAFFAPVQDAPFWEPVKVTSEDVALRMAVGADGAVHAIHHCEARLARAQVGTLCHALVPKIAPFTDGGLTDSYGEVARLPLGEVYKGYDGESASYSVSAAIALDDADSSHVAFYRPIPGGFAVAYQGAPLETSATEYLDDAAPLESPVLRLQGDKVSLVVRDSAERFTLYVKDAAGWHRARVDVPDLDSVGTIDIAP